MNKSVIVTILLLVCMGIFSFWWIQGTAPVNAQDQTQKIFTVKPGQSIREIAISLRNDGLIKDTVLFFLLVKKLGIEGSIQAGNFRLSPSMTSEQIADNLTHGTEDIWVTIPEGKRAEEVAEILEKSLPTYDASWKAELIKHEGYLFPDTYLLPAHADLPLVVSLMTNTFEEKYKTIPVTATGLTKKDIVIIASLIEREAKHDSDRPLVSSVISNRLAIGMALQLDATVQYVLGYQPNQKNWWKKAITLQDLTISSAYNTYKNPGLPPAPIANPGIAALKAAANPAKTNYLYYIADKNGINRYAKTLDEHNENIRKFGL